MSKNNRLINSLKEVASRNRANNIAKASEDLVTHVYASVALALHREYGWGYKRINRLFLQAQELCDNLGNDNLVDLCEEETGISIQRSE